MKPAPSRASSVLHAALVLTVTVALVISAVNFLALAGRESRPPHQAVARRGHVEPVPPLAVPKDGGARAVTSRHPVHDEESTGTLGPTPAACTGSPHFSLQPAIMPPAFKADMESKIRKIRARWGRNPSWRAYTKADVDDCDTATPECAFYKCLAFDDGDTRPYRKCCVEHKKLRDTGIWVMRQLEEHNITYFLSTGTALGAVRHAGAIIPWDTDVDIAVLPKDTEAVRRLFTSLKHEHHFHPDTLGKKMFWIHASRNGRPRDGPHVEIFYDPVYSSKPAKLFPLQRCSFYNASAWCPGTDMFTAWFGNWHVYGGCHYHDDGRVTMYENGKRIDKTKCE